MKEAVNINFGQNFCCEAVLSSSRELISPEVIVDTAHRVKSAKVAYVNYNLLQNDFPQLRTSFLERCYPELKDLKEEKKEVAVHQRIDEWVLFNCAFVSASQTFPNEVNTPIDLGDASVEVYRPQYYGRAFIISCKNNKSALTNSEVHPDLLDAGGLLDLKGVGVGPNKRPKQGYQKDGLMELFDVFHELVMEELVQQIFTHSGVSYQTVPTYAVLDYGFGMNVANRQSTTSAGIYVRRVANRPSRHLGNPGSDIYRMQTEIEFLLRRYGLTSTGGGSKYVLDDASGALTIESDLYVDLPTTTESIEPIRTLARYESGQLILKGINAQVSKLCRKGTGSSSIHDFSTYNVQENFQTPFFTFAWDTLLNIGEIYFPGGPNYPQPDPELAISYEQWGAPRFSTYHQAEIPSVLHICLTWAEDFASGYIEKHALLDKLHSLFYPLSIRCNS